MTDLEIAHDNLERAASVRSVADVSSDRGAARLLLSVAEGAGLLGISRTTMYELVGSGRLPTVKLGRLRKVRIADLEAFVDSLDDGPLPSEV